MQTAQEAFWAGEFGDEYIGRNQDAQIIASKTALFSRILGSTRGVSSVRELGANIGINILAIKSLLPRANFQAVEINQSAFARLEQIPDIHAVCGSLYEQFPAGPVDLAFTSGVLIHLAPEKLPLAYDRLHEAGRRYVLVVEYYNPAPIEVSYRGHSGKLFKRDFAWEFMERHSDFHLIDYGFVYRGDPVFPGDDFTWFLMERQD